MLTVPSKGYNYSTGCDGSVISAADNIEDVDDDDVIIIDGLTKRFRLPGWRVAWILGPKEFIKAIGSCGSYLDGGTNVSVLSLFLPSFPFFTVKSPASRKVWKRNTDKTSAPPQVPFQEAAIPMLYPPKVRNEMKALQTHFRAKRDYVVGRLEGMGFKLAYKPESTFYIWLDLEGLPEAINDGLNFFHACLQEKTIVVPGIFFDLNPSRRRDLFDSPCHREYFPPLSAQFTVKVFESRQPFPVEQSTDITLTHHSDFVRLSYGPKLEVLKKGMDAFERVIKA